MLVRVSACLFADVQRPAMNGDTDSIATNKMGSGSSTQATAKVHVHRENLQSSVDNLLLVPADGGAEGERLRRRGGGSGDRSSRQAHRKHRSLSSPRTTAGSSSSRASSSNKPKKSRQYLGSASESLTSIPNAIKLSMLNSGLLSVGEMHILLSNPPAIQSPPIQFKQSCCNQANSIEAFAIRHVAGSGTNMALHSKKGSLLF